PVFVPIPVFINPPRHVVPPPNAIIFNNIHNTTVINTINTTIKNETVNRAAQPSAGVQLDRRTARKTTEGALGGRADALAAKVPLPPLLQKRAAKFRQATSNQQQQGALPPKPGQRVIQRQQPDTSPETSSRTGKLSTDHALPGADGKRLPLVNGKPAPDGQNLRGNKLKRQPGRQGVSGGNQEAIGNAGPDRTGKQDTDRKRGKKLRNLPAVNGMPADNGQSAREKFRQNSPKALSERSGGKPRKLTRKDLSAGQSVVEPNDQGSAAASDKGRKVRKLPTVNRMPAENRPSVGERLRKNNPDVFSGDNQGSAKSKKFRRLPSVSAGPTDNGPAVQKRLRRNNPTVFSDENQGSASGNDRRRTVRRLQNEEGSAGRDVTVQRNFKVNRPNQNAQRQFRQERPNEQVLRRQRSEPRSELRSQPRPQMQERSVPREKPQRKKKLSCGQQGEPACNQ
ncbi:MAG: peptidase C14 caspase catalytic subunit p20, partial [Mesorhizobium sp.]